MQAIWSSIQRYSQVTVIKTSPKVGKALQAKHTTFLQKEMAKKMAAVEWVKYLF